ncbi:MAG: L,D-transpeptidase family protein [bacterium]|nr:L,D-transpeptidase family protein [bacterium]
MDKKDDLVAEEQNDTIPDARTDIKMTDEEINDVVSSAVNSEDNIDAGTILPPEEELSGDEDDFDDFSDINEENKDNLAEEAVTESVAEEVPEPEKTGESEEQNPKPKKHIKLPWGKIGIGAGILAGLCAITYFGGVWYYSTHFYPGTTLSNFKCSNLTVEQAEEKIRSEMENYTYTIKERGNKEEHIAGSDIDLQCAEINGVAEAKSKQNPFGWVTDMTARNQKVELIVSYDEDKLYQIAENLDCAVESRAAMDGATAGVYYENGAYHMKEVEGKNIISFSRFYTALRAGIYGTYADMSLEDEGLYVAMAEEDKLKQALAEMNKYVSASITYTKGSQTFVVNGDTINQWLTLNPDYTVTLSSDLTAGYVKELAKQYDTVGGWREMTSSAGSVITVGGGDYGWLVNQAAETEALRNHILAGETVVKEPEYKKKGLGTRGDGYDIPNTYVEVSIAAQKMWYYKDGALVLSSNVVTGNPLQGNGTHTGVFALKYKERNATLKGEGYETPVSYWMPFNGGEGLHDANWRGAFGGSIYRGGGSHGCVNLPPSVAASLFSSISPGTPVIVY